MGALFALNNFTRYTFDQTWPVLLIVFGLLTLLRRGVDSPQQAPPGVPPRIPRRAYPYNDPAAGGYRDSRYQQPPPGNASTVKGGFGTGAPLRARGRCGRQSAGRRHRMRRHSLTGPLLLLLVGGLFLWRNLHPEAPVFDLVAEYWPFLLIAWGLIRLVEALISSREGWRHGFTGGEVALVVLICIAGSGIWTAHHHGMRFNRWRIGFLGHPVSSTP